MSYPVKTQLWIRVFSRRRSAENSSLPREYLHAGKEVNCGNKATVLAVPCWDAFMVVCGGCLLG